MASANVELVRSIYEAWARGDYGAADIPDFWHEDAEFRPALIGGGLVEGAVYRGHEGIRELAAMQAETWESVTVEPVQIRDLGKYLLVETRLETVGRASGIELTQVTWNVFEVRDGKFASLRVFTEQEEAFEAVGLREKPTA